MANLRINSGGNSSNKINLNRSNSTPHDEEPVIDDTKNTSVSRPVRQQRPRPHYDDDIQDTIDRGDASISEPVVPPPPIPSAPVIEPPKQEPEDEEKSKNKRTNKRNKRSKSKNNKRANKKEKQSKASQYKTAEEAYAAYKVRRKITFGCLIVATVAIVGFGAYNTFFKHELSAVEAAAYTNTYNNQSQNQQWDSGVQSYLQANLKTLLTKYFQSSGYNRDFDVSNISVERNQPYGDMFLTFFSCDITSGGQTDRVFCNIFIDTKDNKFKAASDVNITTRQPYSYDDGKIEDNSLLDFGDNNEVDNTASKEFQTTLENFLTLGYNNKQDVSSIYKGTTALEFTGTFKSIDKCSVYKNANPLGFNATATYTIVLPSGFQYTTTSYYKIEKNSTGSYVIDMIL